MKRNISVMTRQAIIEHTTQIINQLPEYKAEEIVTFADFIMKRHEETCLSAGIQTLAAQSQTFNFVNEEEELYTLADLKEVYHD